MSDDKERTAAFNPGYLEAWPAIVGGAVFTGCSEWLSFIHERLQKDLALAQRLTACRDPSDVSRTCAEFWTEAVHDYQDGAARFGQLHLSAWSAVPTVPTSRDARRNTGKERLSRAA